VGGDASGPQGSECVGIAMIEETPSFCIGWQRRILGCTLALSMASASIADEYEDGLIAYKQGRYEKAIELFMHSAEQGNAKAQHLLGTMYRAGLGTEPDEYKGFEWCQRAAKDGLLETQFQLGLMYFDGDGVTQNDDKAMEWIWLAADRGYPQATEVLQYILANDFGMGC